MDRLRLLRKIMIATFVILGVILALGIGGAIMNPKTIWTTPEQKQSSVPTTQTEQKPEEHTAPQQQEEPTIYGDLRDFNVTAPNISANYYKTTFADITENNVTHPDYTRATFWYKITQETAKFINEQQSSRQAYLLVYSLEATTMYKELFTQHNAIQVTIIEVVDSYDSYGNPHQIPWITTTMSKHTADKVNWDNFDKVVANDWSALFRIVDNSYIDPSLLA